LLRGSGMLSRMSSFEPRPPWDHDSNAWAARLGISKESLDLYLDSEVLDLHNDLYVPARLYGYNVHRVHRPRLFGALFFGHSDLPRIRHASLSGVVFDIATNPLRTSGQRASVTHKNIERIRQDLAQYPDDFRLVSSHSEYRAARAAGATACFVGIQGGQAFQHDEESLAAIPDVVSRVTLVHLTSSRIGHTSSPLGAGKGGLKDTGAALIEHLNHKRILVDLAHINREGYMEAAKLHDRSQPLVCTHTGVQAVRPCWRNIDDEQIRVIAETGGTIGIIFHSGFLAKTWLRCDPDRVIDHMAHIIDVVGDEFVSIGTDYDGVIRPPRRLREVTDMPVLVQSMLDRGWSEDRIRRILGQNALRIIQEIRP